MFHELWITLKTVLTQLIHRVLPAASKGLITADHLLAAKLCKNVYLDSVEHLETYIESKDTGAQVTVTLVDKRAVVCYRGSDDLSDWRHNFDSVMVPFVSRKHKASENRVHCGFFLAHNSVKAKVYEKLNALIDSGECDSVLFTGHSLGGVCSAVAAFDFSNENDVPIEVITFGSPMLGNRELADAFDIKCTRIVNDRDLVTTAPFTKGYHHVGEAIQMRDDPDGGGILQNFWKNFEFGVLDHDIDNYISGIERCLKKQV